jgi:hypothetical protein
MRRDFQKVQWHIFSPPVGLKTLLSNYDGVAEQQGKASWLLPSLPHSSVRWPIAMAAGLLVKPSASPTLHVA